MHENAPVLQAERRERTGSRYAKRLRDTGRLPAVVYGHGEEPAHISVDAKSTIRAIHDGDRVFRLALDGKQDIVLLRDVQFDYLGDGIVHADLSRVSLDEVTHAHVRVRLVGDAIGLKQADTTLVHPHDEISVECKLRDLPDTIEVDISGLKAGESITAGEIQLPAGVRLISDESSVLATITSSMKAAPTAEEETVAAGDEPEIVGRKKDEEEGGD
ncbi:MAG: 50S ribosomal protein L25 [Phycisphaerales bacterium]